LKHFHFYSFGHIAAHAPTKMTWRYAQRQLGLFLMLRAATVAVAFDVRAATVAVAVVFEAAFDVCQKQR
jgi:hypothetical protein